MQSPSESRRGALHAALVSVLLAMAVAFALLNHEDAIAQHGANDAADDSLSIGEMPVDGSPSGDP